MLASFTSEKNNSIVFSEHHTKSIIASQIIDLRHNMARFCSHIKQRQALLEVLTLTTKLRILMRNIYKKCEKKDGTYQTNLSL